MRANRESEEIQLTAEEAEVVDVQYDLIEELLSGDPERLAEARRRVKETSGGAADRREVRRAERIAADPRCEIEFDERGFTTVDVGQGVRRAGGRFTVPTIAQLQEAVTTRARPGSVRFGVLLGTDNVTDVGALQAFATPGSMFQVASQFNCLESPGSYITPVYTYFDDSTQGPRAAISAFPGALVRHYAAPDAETGGCFTQTGERCLNLLADALPEEAGKVKAGYLRMSEVPDPALARAELEYSFDQIRVGIHEGIEVMRGVDWDGAVEGRRLIGQACTSTIASGIYGDALSGAAAGLAAVILRAGYLGTILGAAAARCDRVVLTLLGGGVFGNPIGIVLDALEWALDEANSVGVGPLEVVLNARDRREDQPRLLEIAGRHGGTVVDTGGHHPVSPGPNG
ncbi:MAG TPA: hypothetical protein VFC82_11940 [Actinomycetaceae bacterium]|nr:hypothetical protein [Actinomycetaceae bacterium]